MKAWFKHFILLSAILLCALESIAKRVKPLYQDFVIVNNKIYVLTNGGYLKIYNTDDGKLVGKFVSSATINLICKDRIGNLVVVLNNDEISRLKSDGNWEKVGSYHGNIFSIAFNSKNTCFLVTNRGVYNCTTREAHMPDDKFSHSEWSHFGKGNGWETNPSEYDDNMGGYMSNNDILWASSDHGEWGDDLYIFDTATNTFYDYTKVAGLPRFELNERVFGFLGGTFDAQFGIEVVTYDKKTDPNGSFYYEGSVCYKQDNDPAVKNFIPFFDDFYVGGCTYNGANHLVYLITGKGLFTIDPKKPPIKFSELKPVPNFKMITHPVERFIYRPSKNKKKRYEMQSEYISKIEFASNGNLVLLAPYNGIRIFDGKKLILIQ